MAEQSVTRRLAAILAADMVGNSRLMEADEAGTLAPVYCWFTEDFDTPDLKDAEALLDELA